MKTLQITDRTDLPTLLAELEGSDEDLVLARNGQPVARLSKLNPIQRTPGILSNSPAWRDFHYDPAIFTALSTDDELPAEGWPV